MFGLLKKMVVMRRYRRSEIQRYVSAGKLFAAASVSIGLVVRIFFPMEVAIPVFFMGKVVFGCLLVWWSYVIIRTINEGIEED